MAKRHEIPFALQEGDTGASQNSRETLINMFAEVTISGRAQIIRRQRAALRSALAQLGEKRCIEKFGDLHYCIVDVGFYSFDGSALTHLADIGSSSGRCSMIFNDNAEVMISDGQNGYFWNGAVMAAVDSPFALGNLAYIGGFGIANVPGTGKFCITAENDFSAVDALAFATAASSPDLLRTVFVNHNQLLLPGAKTTEVWQLSGGADFPFSPITDAIMERGCGAALSYAAEDNTTFFLGDDWLVYRVDGYRPAVISTRAIEHAISGVSTGAKSAAYATIYTSAGHKFYTLTFPGELTIQYNITTGLWSRAKTFGLDYWRMFGSAGHQSDYYLTNAGICELTRDVNLDEGGPIWRGGISAPGSSGSSEQITIYDFFLDAEVGRMDVGKDANVMLRCALDGETFGNERVASLGATGNFVRRTMWRGLGQGRRPVIELGTTDDFEFTIVATGATTEVSSG